jgi:hypothetical protein
MKNWNTRALREFDLFNYNISIPPDYTGDDVVNINPASRHTKVKIGINSNNKGRLHKRIA